MLGMGLPAAAWRTHACIQARACMYARAVRGAHLGHCPWCKLPMCWARWGAPAHPACPCDTEAGFKCSSGSQLCWCTCGITAPQPVRHMSCNPTAASCRGSHPLASAACAHVAAAACRGRGKVRRVSIQASSSTSDACARTGARACTGARTCECTAHSRQQRFTHKLVFYPYATTGEADPA